MSLVTYPNSKSKASGRVPKKTRTQAGSAPTIASRLGKMFAAAGRLCVNIFEAIAEARVQKAMIEAELYRNRYMHTSKNDDDLPVVR
jgi:hypothetical protein